MKNLPIFLVACMAQVANNYGMEPELSLWYTFPKEMVTQIVACSDLHTKENLRLVDRQLSGIACKKNIKNLLYHFPCVLSRQDHLNCMVTYAKESDSKMVLRLIKTASYCDHADWLDVVPYFLSETDPELMLIKAYNDCPYENWLEELLPSIMAVYRGDAHALEQYKITYTEIKDYEGPYNYYYGDTNKITLQAYKNKITPLHIAALRNHPVSIAQLLLIQDLTLLNAVDYCEQTPLFGAVKSNAVETCKFLLSCKNINPNKEDKEQSIPLLLATMMGYFEIVVLLVNYNNAHNIQLINYPFPPWAQPMKHNQEAIKRFLLDPINFQISDLKYSLQYACRYLDVDTLKIFFEFYHAIIDINAQCFCRLPYHKKNDYTLLHCAVDRAPIVAFLLDNGADPDIADTEGKKPIDIAKKDEVKAMLLAKMKQG